jgi:hypothetical protein
MREGWRVEVLRNHPTNEFAMVWVRENVFFDDYDMAVRGAQRVRGIGYRTRVIQVREALCF